MTYLPTFQRKFNELQKKYPKKRPIICITGFSGSGDSTAAEIIQKELKKRGLSLEVRHGSFFFRKIAREMGYEEAKLNEFNNMLEKDPTLTKKVDIMIDEDILERGFKSGGIFPARLSFAVFGEAATASIFILANKTRMARFIARDPKRHEYGMSIKEIVKRMEHRDTVDIKRYNWLYNINYLNLIYKCIIIKNDGTKADLKKKLMKIIIPKLRESGFIN